MLSVQVDDDDIIFFLRCVKILFSSGNNGGVFYLRGQPSLIYFTARNRRFISVNSYDFCNSRTRGYRGQGRTV